MTALILPLSVEFEEKLYAAGRIPGSFMRREGRPGEHAILSPPAWSIVPSARCSPGYAQRCLRDDDCHEP